jgi:PAS domain S-box-containing protein
VKKHKPNARPKGKRSLRALDSLAQAGTSPSATVRSKTEFQRVVHELQARQEELEAQNEELRKTQQLLEASRDRYADLYDFAPIGYTSLDGKGRIREINLTGATILGRERSRLLGTLFSTAVAKGELSAFRGHLRQCRQGSGLVTTELTLALHGRNPAPVQLHSVPIRDPVSQTTMYRTTITDISGRVRVEEALRESEEGQRTLFESAPDPIVVVDAAGRMERVNRQAEVLFGYQRSELIGQTVEMLIPERFRGHHEQHRAGYVGSPHLRPMGAGLQLYGRRKDGSEFPVDIMLSPLASKLSPLVIAVVRDVTEQKQVNETLRRLSIRLLRAQDAERRRIARELHDSTGQNLAAVAMNLSLVTHSAKALDAPAQKALAESITMVEGCVREIRTLSYLLHPPMLDERGLAPALRWFVEGFTKRSGMRVDLEVASHWERPTPEMEIALFRVVQESLTNAHRHAESSTARIRLDGDKTTVRLEVEDAGKGLPNAKAEGQLVMGGVGITGMRERIKQLGGQLQIESGRHGTTVRVTLPLGSATN